MNTYTLRHKTKQYDPAIHQILHSEMIIITFPRQILYSTMHDQDHKVGVVQVSVLVIYFTLSFCEPLQGLFSGPCADTRKEGKGGGKGREEKGREEKGREEKGREEEREGGEGRERERERERACHTEVCLV